MRDPGGPRRAGVKLEGREAALCRAVLWVWGLCAFRSAGDIRRRVGAPRLERRPEPAPGVG